MDFGGRLFGLEALGWLSFHNKAELYSHECKDED